MKVARFCSEDRGHVPGRRRRVCAIIAYWDSLTELGVCARSKFQHSDEYDDYEE